jgi:serine/threonine protein kinase
MNSQRITSISHSTSSPVRDGLSTQIKKAVDSTTEGIVNQIQVRARRFLPKRDLETILSQTALGQLFKELFEEDEEPGPATPGANPDIIHPSNIDDVVATCVTKTIGSDGISRRATLALFLFVMGRNLLVLYKTWLLSTQPNFPSDAQMPFSIEQLDRWQVPIEYRGHILEYQTIFTPVTIQKLQHREFRSWDRLPFIGTKTEMKSGSSGTVYSAKIAPRHWEIKNSDGIFTSEEPMTVALKTFEEIGPMRTSQDATNDFNMERELLDDLRNFHVSHRMLMLDWGSFTVKDEEDRPESHCLIFKLATFSLEDFLADGRCFVTYTTKSLLLTRLVDIVEALAILHDNLKTLHLDIKPENILVFEEGSCHTDGEKGEEGGLTWKLSDFGLARKKDDKQRTDYRVHSSYGSSQPSTLPATRPTGIYQAPEIQERNSSLAGRGSDVWSMGCVALMVLAFMNCGPAAVSELTHKLRVFFPNAEGAERLFYVRSDSRTWNQNLYHDYEYLTDFKPDVGDIPGPEPRFAAAVHPHVIDWSNELYLSYKHRPEQQVIQAALDIIFRRVLRINRQDRIKASELHKRLNRIRDRWISEVEAHKNQMDQGEESPLPPNIIGDPSALCTAIKDDQADTVRELISDPEQVRRPCPEPNCQIQPINMALRNDAYQALEVLLQMADSDVTDICCPSCERTPIEEACVGSGSREALNCFLRHREKFSITREVYMDCKNGLGNDARNLLEELYRTPDPQPSSLLGRITRR